MAQKPVSNSTIACQLGCWGLLIPWLLTAAMIWLWPGFSYGLVERWVCPRGSAIQVEGTQGWFFAVLSDDDSVDMPQVTCVDSRGAVVMRGEMFANVLAYLRVYGVVLVAFYAIVFAAYGIVSLIGRMRRGAVA